MCKPDVTEDPQLEELRALLWNREHYYQDKLRKADERAVNAVNERDAFVREATASLRQALDIAQHNYTARIAHLESELARARTPIGTVKAVHDDGTVDVELFPVRGTFEPSPGQLASRNLRETWPSATSAAPSRESPIERWQRGAPCTWDPYGE